MSIIIAIVVGVLVYLLVRTVVGLIVPVAKFAEASGIIAGVLVALNMLGVI